MNKKGFTLVELMVVVLIIAILAAIALPVYNRIIDNQNNAKAKAMLEVINGGMMRFEREYPNVSIPMPSVALPAPSANITCTYHGENDLTSAQFVEQMVACGYIPRYDYSESGPLEYKFLLQDPENPGHLNYYGYVYMVPNSNMSASSRYCMFQANTNTCIYSAGFNQYGQIIDSWDPGDTEDTETE